MRDLIQEICRQHQVKIMKGRVAALSQAAIVCGLSLLLGVKRARGAGISTTARLFTSPAALEDAERSWAKARSSVVRTAGAFASAHFLRAAPLRGHTGLWPAICTQVIPRRKNL